VLKRHQQPEKPKKQIRKKKGPQKGKIFFFVLERKVGFFSGQ